MKSPKSQHKGSFHHHHYSPHPSSKSKSFKGTPSLYPSYQQTSQISNRQHPTSTTQKHLDFKTSSLRNQFICEQYQIYGADPQYKRKNQQNINRPSKCTQKVGKRQDNQFPSFNQLQNLLKNESMLIQEMKEKCEKQKMKVDRDLQIWSISFENMIDDLKCSVKEAIDQEYRNFVQTFNKIKSEFVNYCHIKKQYWNSYHEQNLQNVRFPGKDYISNENLLTKLNQDLQFCYHHIKYENLSEIHELLLKPILLKSKEIYSHASIQSFYQPHVFNKFMRSTFQQIQTQFHSLYPSIPAFISEFKYSESSKHLRLTQRSRSVQDLSLRNTLNKQRGVTKDSLKFINTAEFQKCSNSQEEETVEQATNPISQYMERSAYTKSKFDGMETYSSTLGSKQQEGKQNNWLKKSKSQSNMKQNRSNQTALVLTYLSRCGQIAVGTKNGYLKLFCPFTLNEVSKYKIFDSSICSIACIGIQNIALGSDLNPSQVALWNYENKSISRFNKHSAAVTCIIDLKDKKHFVSGGFDSLLNIYDYQQKVWRLSQNCEQNISNCVASEQSTLITSHLSSKIRVWKIERQKNSSQIRGMLLNRKIEINEIPVSMSISGQNMHHLRVGTKKQTLTTLQISTGKVLHQIQLESTPQQIINLTKSSEVLLCLKNGKIKHVKSQKNKAIADIDGKCNLDLGIGINPKAILIEGRIYGCNHYKKISQINCWQIQTQNK